MDAGRAFVLRSRKQGDPEGAEAEPLRVGAAGLDGGDCGLRKWARAAAGCCCCDVY